MNDLFSGKSREEIAIDRLRAFCPPEGYHLAFSGGKDSVVILDLAERSGVKFDAHYNITGIDPPELYYFIRDNFPQVERHRPETTIWKLIVKKRMPPTRLIRYCCAYLKERGGKDRIVVTGVRWEESVRRGKRKMVEACFKNSHQHYVHPIIDWSSGDVWNYIKNNNLKYCSLYDEGFKRLGCIMCPMNTNRAKEVTRWPKYYDKYIKAFDLCAQGRRDDGLLATNAKWDTGKQMMEWWMSHDKKHAKDDPDQTVMFE